MRINLSLAIAGLAFLVSCGGSTTGGNAVSASISVDASGATAYMLVSDSSSATLAALTESEALADFYKLKDNGDIEPVIFVDSEGNAQAQAVSIERLDLGGDGSVYILFTTYVLYNDQECLWLVISNTGEADCADPNLRGNNTITGSISYPYFDPDGTVYYWADDLGDSSTDTNLGGLRKRSTDGSIVTLLSHEKLKGLGMSQYDIKIQSSDRIIIWGNMTGEASNVFIYDVLADSMTPLCVSTSEALTTPAEKYETGIGRKSTTFYAAGPDYAYSFGTDVCSGGTESGTFRWDFNDDGAVTISIISDIYVSDFYLTGEGILYAIAGDVAVKLEPDFDPTHIELIPDVDTITIRYEGFSNGMLYYSGSLSDSSNIFRKRDVFGGGTEVDLLQGQDLQVNYFEVADNGDIYFTVTTADDVNMEALDLTTTSDNLYKYNNSTGELEQLDNLPGDLMQIVLL